MIIPVSLLLGSVSLDLVSLYCIKRSNGFKRVAWGVAGLLAIMLAFVLLSFVVRYLPLGIAYSVWGSLGVLGTVLIDRYVFNSRLGKQGLVGVGFILAGIIALQL
ncbi:DMT family transporter [Marinospirillum insulare]|uniref:Spermidine export protein MdtI n=1 Tax=Marinospirillum insulare TaxID=217169 RepID=A0ABQ5ZX14_9GAMM|nr:SMR family transporter [Marinospirillum insulare]GLR63613.1 QacE family quaternary ammonium compound efflux SMR transporter [Marinospirillum insulare]